MSLEKIKSMPHEEWLQSPWFYSAICLALFCLICIITKFRKQISKRCKTTKNKWSVKFKGRENSVSKPPSASIDEDTELYAKDWRDVSTMGQEVKLVQQYIQEKKRLYKQFRTTLWVGSEFKNTGSIDGFYYEGRYYRLE